MNDLINMLQTLALTLILAIVLLILGWVVYAFGKFALAFEKLLKRLDSAEEPRLSIHTPTTATTASATVPAPKLEVPAKPEPVEEVKRYPCHRCKCRLPEEPIHSRIEEDKTILVFKCKRCGKETDVDPLTAVPITGGK